MLRFFVTLFFISCFLYVCPGSCIMKDPYLFVTMSRYYYFLDCSGFTFEQYVVCVKQMKCKIFNINILNIIVNKTCVCFSSTTSRLNVLVWETFCE